MGPVALQLNLTGAKAVKLPLSEFYSVQLAMDAGSGTAFAGYTAANVGKQLAFVNRARAVLGESIQLLRDIENHDNDATEEHGRSVHRASNAICLLWGRQHTP